MAVVDVLCSSDKMYNGIETAFRAQLTGTKLLAKSSEAYLTPQNGTMRMRVVADVSSVEVFFGDGEAVFAHSVYPPENARALRLFAEGEGITLKKCDLHTVKSIW